MMGGNMPSLADIAAVTRNGDGDGFGGNNGWWVLIILFALFGGWGNRGGYGNGGGSYEIDPSLQRGFDTQAIISKLDGINNGICSLGYDQLNQMNSINTNILQAGYNNMQNANALSTQISDCCCKNQTGQMQIMNQMGTDTCAITNAINQAVQTITQNCNANYRSLHDEQVAQQMETYKTQIANLTQQLNNCDRDKSNAEQSAYLLSQLKQPQAIPAYQVPNPNFPWGPFGFGNPNEFNNGFRQYNC